MGGCTSTVSRKNLTVINFTQSHAQSRVSSVFRAPSQNFKIQAFPNVLAFGRSYEHGFTKKCDGLKHCTKSRAESSFDRFFINHLGILKYWPFPRVEFRSVFRASSQNFKILAIRKVFGHGKSYEHGFVEKHDGHKLYKISRVESSFDRFFMHRVKILKYWRFPTY
ncbi:hypothetical protein BHM03_00021804 [Ensete ventricosum]|nr:hypothetical protein BHM03_00021804 [Ensete ventricosum]